jgi:transposase
VTLELVEQFDEQPPTPKGLRLVTNDRPEPIESEQAQHETEHRYFDSVGRPRKLAAGAMQAIMREYRKGNFTTRQLAERYGVSVSLILTIVYHTPRGSGKRPAPERQRPVVVPND